MSDEREIVFLATPAGFVSGLDDNEDAKFTPREDLAQLFINEAEAEAFARAFLDDITYEVETYQS